MICLYLSSKCQEHLDKLADVYEDVTGGTWNSAEFVENLIFAITPDMLLEAMEVDDA